MKFSICEHAETRRNLERERNNPVGLIYLIFIICAVFCDEPATAAVNCSIEAPFGTDSSINRTPYEDYTVFKFCSGDGFNCNHLDAGDVGHLANNGSSHPCDNYYNQDWCRICKDCSDGYYPANRCGTNGRYHAERIACSGSSQHNVEHESRICKDMYFGPLVNGTDLKNSEAVWNYDGVNFSFNSSGLNSSAGCTFNKTVPGFLSNNSCGNIFGYSVPSNFTLTQTTQTSGNLAALHCTAGSVTWTPDDTTAGNAAAGFYVKFTAKTGNAANQIKPNPKIMCTQCQTGWKLTTRTYGHDLCEACDTNKNFAMVLDKCFCKKGYAYDSSQDKCVDTDADSRNFVSPNNDGTYYCKPGYVVNDYIPESATDYEYYHCGPCKTDDNFVNGTNGCECATGYDRDDLGTTNTEDDTCKISTTQVYVDSTGWFTIPGTGSCREDWWQE